MKSYFGDYMILDRIIDAEAKRKNAQRRQENKVILGKIKHQNRSRPLGQHHFVYLSHRSR